MEVPLPMILVDHTGLLQKVTEDVATHGGALWAGQDMVTAQGDWGMGPIFLSPALLGSNSSSGTSCMGSNLNFFSAKKGGNSTLSTWQLHLDVQQASQTQKA